MSDIEKIIKERHSVRNFTDQRIEGNILNSLREIVEKCNNESGLNIQLALNETKAFGEGHYGNFINCKNYVALIGDKEDVRLNEKCGYYGEKIVIVIAIGYGVNQGVSHKVKEFEKVSNTPKDSSPEWYIKGVEYALLAPTAINQQKFVFELVGENEVLVKLKIGPCTKIDLGIIKYHFELGAGKENFKWTNLK